MEKELREFKMSVASAQTRVSVHLHVRALGLSHTHAHMRARPLHTPAYRTQFLGHEGADVMALMMITMMVFILSAEVEKR